MKKQEPPLVSKETYLVQREEVLKAMEELKKHPMEDTQMQELYLQQQEKGLKILNDLLQDEKALQEQIEVTNKAIRKEARKQKVRNFFKIFKTGKEVLVESVEARNWEEYRNDMEEVAALEDPKDVQQDEMMYQIISTILWHGTDFISHTEVKVMDYMEESICDRPKENTHEDYRDLVTRSMLGQEFVELWRKCLDTPTEKMKDDPMLVDQNGTVKYYDYGVKEAKEYAIPVAWDVLLGNYIVFLCETNGTFTEGESADFLKMGFRQLSLVFSSWQAMAVSLLFGCFVNMAMQDASGVGIRFFDDMKKFIYEARDNYEHKRK